MRRTTTGRAGVPRTMVEPATPRLIRNSFDPGVAEGGGAGGRQSGYGAFGSTMRM